MPDTLSKYTSSLDQDIEDGFVEILDEDDEPVDNFDPSEARDAHGQWSTGGGGVDAVAKDLDKGNLMFSRTRGGGGAGMTAGAVKDKIGGEEEAIENNHKVAALVVGYSQATPTSPDDVKKMLFDMNNAVNAGIVSPDKGPFREWNTKTSKMDFKDVPKEFDKFSNTLYQKWDEGDPVGLAAYAEYNLNAGDLHPFYDGCGRTSRAVAATILLKDKMPLPVYRGTEEYFQHTGSLKDFTNYFKTLIPKPGETRNAWSDEARQASAEARKAGAKPNADPIKSTNLTHQYLSQISMHQGMNTSSPLKYRGMEDLIHREGIDYQPGGEVPKGLMGQKKLCFQNAYRLVEHDPDRYVYVEGFARPSTIPIPVEHAFALDTKTGKVVDPTWPDGVEYKGIPLKQDYVRKTILAKETYGVLDNHQQHFPVMRGAAGHSLKDIVDPRGLNITHNYSPDQPRDEHGRWADGGGSGGTKAIAGRESEQNKVDPATIKSLKGAFEHSPGEMLGTVADHTNELGEWKQHRVALHAQIIQGELAKATPVRTPTVYMLGGGPASGKSTLVQTGVLKFDNTVPANGDELKTRLPEYDALVSAGDPAAASYVHAESGHLVKSIVGRALKQSKNVLIDGTGDTGFEKLKAKVESYREAGAKRVVAEYVTAPTAVAQERAIARGKETGRYIHPAAIAIQHRAVSEIVPKMARAHVFDEMRVWDTNVPVGQPPVKVMEQIGPDMRVLDKKRWQEFKDKANE